MRPDPTDKLPCRTRACLGLALALALAGCGGGGGTQSPAPGPAPKPPPPVDVSPVAAADPGSALPAGWQHGAFIEIFVRSYQDSDGDGNGDLQGLISRLDYLQGLGVKGIWLLPVTASEDHDHGYAVADYRQVETAYGSLADLDALLAAAHARGIGVILDYVINHSAATNPLFENSAAGAGNPYRDWYVWQPQDPGGWSIYGADPWHPTSNGAYFGAFWDRMPEWNLNNPAVVAYHHDNLRFWLNRGVDGFRFDAVGNLVENGPAQWLDQPQNYTLMSDVRSLLAGYSQRYMVCEAPDDPQGFGNDKACGGAFAFDLHGEFVKAAQGNPASVAEIANYFNSAPPGMAPLVSNHDSFAGRRLWNQVGGNLAQYKLAAAGYLLLPGTPFIYYGEEIGMAGAASLSGDAALRTPMSWTADATRAGFTTGTPYRALSANVTTNNAAAQEADPLSIYGFYRALLALRNGRPSIAAGSYESAFASGNLLGYQRAIRGAQGDERTLVLVNYGAQPAAIDVAGLPAGSALNPAPLLAVDVAAGSATPCAASAAHVDVAAQSVCVFSVGP